MTTSCDLCGSPCDTKLGSTFQRAVGWVSTDAGKGFKLDHREPVFAHKACIELNATVGMKQERMFA